MPDDVETTLREEINRVRTKMYALLQTEEPLVLSCIILSTEEYRRNISNAIDLGYLLGMGELALKANDYKFKRTCIQWLQKQLKDES